ncbi:hypothetical protein HYDPIDRAFT_28368 [Hydnomerulius pinastri MD-312]|uniref:T6SS Phospholipase effector Tle1-like catalytic domain-containing protein n=1 Tax=Hydnomerulius pinastri MD-312 TaxID=994086 RepID=A0A0C9W9I9_9AGAM|nr:hypothetical protein HYDPIDRAFT_28368 [Hydnomerulius pinastri MD-312]
MSERGSTDKSSTESARAPRLIVLCFDGTAGQFDSMNTNVVKFFGLLRKDLPEEQITYYQAGVGTYFSPGAVSPLWTWLAQIMDEGVAWEGFSRGAYTARALAGMLNKVGLLPRDNTQQVSFAYKLYKRTDKEGVELAAGFKKTFSQDVPVDFMGVWDTVQSTGILINRVLPFTDSNTCIRVFRQALALDEHRARFKPNLYHWPKLVEDSEGSGFKIAERVASLEEKAIQKLKAIKLAIVSAAKRLKRKRHTSEGEQAKDYGTFQNDTSRKQPLGTDDVAGGCDETEVVEETRPVEEFAAPESSTITDVLEVWFSGCHSDIGGGNVQDDVQVSLAQITLHWMVEQVLVSKCGILFDSEALACIGITYPSTPAVPAVLANPAAEGALEETQLKANEDGLAIVNPEPQAVATKLATSGNDYATIQETSNEPAPPASGSYSEYYDALAPLYDELKINKLWWLLEIFPVSFTWQDADGVWHSKWSINLGKGRFIPFHQPKFHHTVKERVEYKPLKYTPQAIYDHHEVYV